MVTSLTKSKAKFPAIEGNADCLACKFKRLRRQPYRAGLFRAMELDRPDHGAVIVDTGSAARTIRTSELEQLTNNKLARCFRFKILRECWAECEQANNSNRMSRNHVGYLHDEATLTVQFSHPLRAGIPHAVVPS